MSYNTRNSSGFETRNIKTAHYGLETIVYLGSTQSAITYSKLTIETLEQGEKYVQS